MSKLDRLKDLVFKLNLAALVFVLVLAIVELAAWQLCRVLAAPHHEMREPAYLEAYRDLDNAEEHLANLKRSNLSLKYQPYCLWGLSEVRTSTYNVLPDWGGIRKTIDVPRPDAARKVRVFLFGGSTAFCSRVPDEHTIASRLSANLSERWGDVEFSVTNFGRGGYLSDQEVVLLTQVLTDGGAPDLVIFYDGTNDAINKVCKGIPHYQYERFRSVETGGEPHPGLLRAAMQYDYVGKLVRLAAGTPPNEVEYVTDEAQLLANARGMAARYRENVTFVEKLGKAYGFRAAFFWQPDLLTTGKPLTDEETDILRDDPKSSVWRPGFEMAHRAVKETMDGEAAFCDLSRALDETEACVFFDVCHISARANDVIGKRVVEVLAEDGYLKPPDKE